LTAGSSIAGNETQNGISISFVTCISDIAVLGQRLLASPCFSERKLPLTAYFNASSAAEAFNASSKVCSKAHSDSWLAWVHEDVFLPSNWEDQLSSQISMALRRWPKLAVVGVYGGVKSGEHAFSVGHVLDRGSILRPPTQLPCLVDSLDELLFAVRVSTGLTLDPALKFDFYATDLVLQAQENGWDCAVVDAYCEHWSGTVQTGPAPTQLARRIKSSAEVFEAKWVHSMPITTSCFHMKKPGDVAAYIDSMESAPCG